jgi:hypothetical protein
MIDASTKAYKTRWNRRHNRRRLEAFLAKKHSRAQNHVTHVASSHEGVEGQVEIVEIDNDISSASIAIPDPAKTVEAVPTVLDQNLLILDASSEEEVLNRSPEVLECPSGDEQVEIVVECDIVENIEAASECDEYEVSVPVHTAHSLPEALARMTSLEFHSFSSQVAQDSRRVLYEFQVTTSLIDRMNSEPSPDQAKLLQLLQRAQALQYDIYKLNAQTDLVHFHRTHNLGWN